MLPCLCRVCLRAPSGEGGPSDSALKGDEDSSCFHASLLLCLHRLLDPNSNTEIANYPIYKILFCVRGHDGTLESDCFAFTESHYNTEIFRIHVFRCQIREAVSISGSLLSVWLALALQVAESFLFCSF